MPRFITLYVTTLLLLCHIHSSAYAANNTHGADKKQRAHHSQKKSNKISKATARKKANKRVVSKTNRKQHALKQQRRAYKAKSAAKAKSNKRRSKARVASNRHTTKSKLKQKRQSQKGAKKTKRQAHMRVASNRNASSPRYKQKQGQRPAKKANQKKMTSNTGRWSNKSQNRSHTEIYKPKHARTHYPVHVDMTLKMGKPRHLVRVGMVAPLIQRPEHHLFTSIIGMGDSRKNAEGNIGLGYRGFIHPEWIVGGYGFYDYRYTANNNGMHQLTFGAELMSKLYEFRANVYVPITEDVVISTRPLARANFDPTVNRTRITRGATVILERALYGLDVEAGVTLHTKFPIKGFAAVYYFDNNMVKSIVGGRVRTELSLNDYVSVEAELNYDRVRDIAAYAGAKFKFNWWGDGKPKLSPLKQKMIQLPVRDVDILVDTPTVDRVDAEESRNGCVPLIHPNASGNAGVNNLNDFIQFCNEHAHVDDIATVDTEGHIKFLAHGQGASQMTPDDFQRCGLHHVHPTRVGPMRGLWRIMALNAGLAQNFGARAQYFADFGQNVGLVDRSVGLSAERLFIALRGGVPGDPGLYAVANDYTEDEKNAIAFEMTAAMNAYFNGPNFVLFNIPEEHPNFRPGGIMDNHDLKEFQRAVVHSGINYVFGEMNFDQPNPLVNAHHRNSTPGRGRASRGWVNPSMKMSTAYALLWQGHEHYRPAGESVWQRQVTMFTTLYENARAYNMIGELHYGAVDEHGYPSSNKSCAHGMFVRGFTYAHGAMGDTVMVTQNAMPSAQNDLPGWSRAYCAAHPADVAVIEARQENFPENYSQAAVNASPVQYRNYLAHLEHELNERYLIGNPVESLLEPHQVNELRNFYAYLPVR